MEVAPASKLSTRDAMFREPELEEHTVNGWYYVASELVARDNVYSAAERSSPMNMPCHKIK